MMTGSGEQEIINAVQFTALLAGSKGGDLLQLVSQIRPHVVNFLVGLYLSLQPPNNNVDIYY